MHDYLLFSDIISEVVSEHVQISLLRAVQSVQQTTSITFRKLFIHQLSNMERLHHISHKMDKKQNSIFFAIPSTIKYIQLVKNGRV